MMLDASYNIGNCDGLCKGNDKITQQIGFCNDLQITKFQQK